MPAIQKTEVFGNWFLALRDRMAQRRVQARIDRLEIGNPGQHRVLARGVVEMKVDYGPGYRIYYVERGGAVVILLCGGDKDSQDADIALALEMSDQV